MERLRHIREQVGYSQQDLADASGVSQHTISEIELGRRKPQGRTLRKLAKALGVEVADFYGESAYPKVEAPPSPSEPSLFNGLEEERREADITEHFEDEGALFELLNSRQYSRVCIEFFDDGSAFVQGYRT